MVKDKFLAVPVEQLKLDLNNPRHGLLENEDEVVDWMLRKLGPKIFALAEDIVAFGFDPSERLILCPRGGDGKYIVVEGNRRLTARKLLLKPSLIKEASVAEKFEKLARSFNGEANFDCVVIHDEGRRRHFQRLKHTGSNDGIGRMSWGSLEGQRFLAQIEGFVRHKKSIVLLDELVRRGATTPEQAEEVPITGLDRLVGDPDFRRFAKIQIKGDDVKYLGDTQETVDLLKGIVEQLVSGLLPVREVYTKIDRRRFMRKLGKDLGIAPETGKEGERAAKKRSKKRPKKSHDRSMVIPISFEAQISVSRTQDICYELQDLNAIDYNNAAALLFRTFIEFSIENYVERNRIPRRSNDTLANRMEDSLNHLMTVQDVPRKIEKVTRKAISSQHVPWSGGHNGPGIDGERS